MVSINRKLVVAGASVIVLLLSILSISSTAFFLACNEYHYLIGIPQSFARNEDGYVYVQDKMGDITNDAYNQIQYRLLHYIVHIIPGQSIYEESGWLWGKTAGYGNLDTVEYLGYNNDYDGCWRYWYRVKVQETFAQYLSLTNLCWGWNPVYPAWEGQYWSITWKIEVFINGVGPYNPILYFVTVSHDET